MSDRDRIFFPRTVPQPKAGADTAATATPRFSWRIPGPRFPLPDGWLDDGHKEVSATMRLQQDRLMREALLGTTQATLEPEPAPLRFEDLERAMAALRATMAVQPPETTIVTSKFFRADKPMKLSDERDIFLMLHPSLLDGLATRLGPLVPNVKGYAPQYMGVPIVDIDIMDEDAPAQRERKQRVIERMAEMFAHRAEKAMGGARP